MVEQRMLSLPQIVKVIQEAYVEATGRRAAKKDVHPDHYRGEQYIYAQVYIAKKRAEKEGREFWIEPSKSSQPWHPKTYDEEQVVGILDELHQMIKNADSQRQSIYEQMSFAPHILNKAEEILFSPTDKK